MTNCRENVGWELHACTMFRKKHFGTRCGPMNKVLLDLQMGFKVESCGSAEASQGSLWHSILWHKTSWPIRTSTGGQEAWVAHKNQVGHRMEVQNHYSRCFKDVQSKSKTWISQSANVVKKMFRREWMKHFTVFINDMLLEIHCEMLQLVLQRKVRMRHLPHTAHIPIPKVGEELFECML